MSTCVFIIGTDNCDSLKPKPRPGVLIKKPDAPRLRSVGPIEKLSELKPRPDALTRKPDAPKPRLGALLGWLRNSARLA